MKKQKACFFIAFTAWHSVTNQQAAAGSVTT